MRPVSILLAAVFAASAQLPVDPNIDDQVRQLIPHLSAAAEAFSRTTRQYVGRETLRQRAAPRNSSKKKSRKGTDDLTFRQREIVSYYGLCTFKGSQAIHEIRQVVSVDGHRIESAEAARDFLEQAVASGDDGVKWKLVNQFADEGLTGVATDFGPLLLLFSKRSIGDFTFESGGLETIGSVRTSVFTFRQNAGKERLEIIERRKHEPAVLKGKIWVRVPDYLPVRIALTGIRHKGSNEVRDEATVDYAQPSGNALLPIAVSHRRFENEDLTVEDAYQYSDWQPMKLR